MGTLLVVAVLLRVPFLVSPPLLSDDIHRYLFDGMVQNAGESPYVLSPGEYVTTDPIVSDLAAKVNHPGLVTLYPPAAQLFFRLVAPLGMTGMKAVLVSADLMVVCLLLIALPRQGVPRHNTVLYAWNPLVVWEIAWSGHIDALALPFLLGAGLLTVGRTRPEVFLAGALFAVAVWVKLIPLIFCPFLLLGAGPRAGWGVAGGAVTSLALVVPYLPTLGNALETLFLYGTTWEFSGFLFRAVRDLTGMNLLARLFTASLFCCGIAGLLFRQYRTGGPPFSWLGWAAFLWLLTTPTLHPWYGLYLAVWLPMMSGPQAGPAKGGLPPLLLTVTPLLGYGVLTDFWAKGLWVESPWTPFWVFVIPVAAFVTQREQGRRRPPSLQTP